jgi:hypothetical protein
MIDARAQSSWLSRAALKPDFVAARHMSSA